MTTGEGYYDKIDIITVDFQFQKNPSAVLSIESGKAIMTNSLD